MSAVERKEPPVVPDLSHVGRRYLAPGQVVSADWVAEYASAVSGADEVYSPGSVPPTFAAVYCLLPSLAPVPVRTGDVVVASAEVASVESKRGMTFVTLDLAATNQSGATVCRGRSLLLLRGAGR